MKKTLQFFTLLAIPFIGFSKASPFLTKKAFPYFVPVNLVANGDFELTSTNAQNFTNWTESNTDIAIENAFQIGGLASVRFVGSAAARNITSDAITVEPGKTYRFQFTGRIQTAGGANPGTAGTANLTGTILNGLDNAATSFTTLTTQSSSNITLIGDYTVPAGQTSIKIRLAKTANIAYTDDVSLIDVATLPITLSSFNADVLNNGVSINWTTASETNNDKFTIYRSNSNGDFMQIGTVNGNGNSSTIKNYNFIDKNPTKGTNYYRLSQTDFNGLTEMFNPIAINYNFNTEKENLKIYSNQSVTKLNISWAEEEFVLITIMDLSGKKLYSKSIKMINGDNSVSLNTESLLISNH